MILFKMKRLLTKKQNRIPDNGSTILFFMFLIIKDFIPEIQARLRHKKNYQALSALHLLQN
jgi:hypothetical protein